jgi:hypothetical protein
MDAYRGRPGRCLRFGPSSRRGEVKSLEDEVKKGMDRRTFLRRAAVTGAAAAWATPIIQTVTARPAFAANGTPVECSHSSSPWFTDGEEQCSTGGCKQACKASFNCQDNCADAAAGESNDACTLACDVACPEGSSNPLGSRVCCDGSFCDSANWSLTGACGGPDSRACYTGEVSCNDISTGDCFQGT